MSFRKNFTSINSRESRPNNFSLSQGTALKEGFTGIPNDLASDESMYNMWGTDFNNTSNIGKKPEETED